MLQRGALQTSMPLVAPPRPLHAWDVPVGSRTQLRQLAAEAIVSLYKYKYRI